MSAKAVAMNVMSLCSGIGGLDLATKAVGGRTVVYVEINPYRQAVLQARMRDGWLDSAPIWPDLKTFNGVAWRGIVDCVAAGFPCTPFSQAGRRRGELDPNNLWPDVARVIAECGPAVVFLENSPRISHYAFHEILPRLQAMGYDVTKATVTAAAELGAGHIRRRLFILAHTNGWHLWQQSRPWRTQSSEEAPVSRSMACHAEGKRTQPGKQQGQSCCPEQDGLSSNSNGTGQRQSEGPFGQLRRRLEDTGKWDVEPDVGRVVHGLPHRLDRVSALGDAVVPQQAVLAWNLLAAIQARA